MGLLQNAYLTYDHFTNLAGHIRQSQEPLAPVGHIITRAQIKITIDSDGKFVSAEALDKFAPKIIIPATEESSGRVGSSARPHPLCDQLCYLAPYNSEKYTSYVTQLTSWAESSFSHPKLNPILSYIRGKTILSDLVHSDVIKLDDHGIPQNEKSLVCWDVIGLGEDLSGPCWTDQSLFESFIRYNDLLQAQREQDLCMITGKVAPLASQHPKGIIAINGNAKLISANDNSNFTYRGRFSQSNQAATVSYIASQKAHNALRWLAANQGVSYGSRTFICWNPNGYILPSSTNPMMRTSAAKIVKPTEYREALFKVLGGYKAALPVRENVIIAAFDAATTGRLSVTYYNELMASDFLQRIYRWDITCCWNSWKFGIHAPALYQIISCAFGSQRNNGDYPEVDDRVMAQQLQRLLSCRIDQCKMPADIARTLTHKASSPLSYCTSACRENVLFTACAVIRKYRMDQFKEEWNMVLDPNCPDYSYQYGRLLAVMEKAERDTYDEKEGREPNAIRLQSVFCKRPLYATRIIIEQLKRGYYPRLAPNNRSYYEKLIEEIFLNLAQFPDLNAPLADTYLLGYYLQKNALYQSKSKNETEETDNV